jgi:hypothetical protein
MLLQGSKGNTPLHYACLLERTKHAELLLEYGALPDARNEHGQRPLDLLPRDAVRSTKLYFKRIFDVRTALHRTITCLCAMVARIAGLDAVDITRALTFLFLTFLGKQLIFCIFHFEHLMQDAVAKQAAAAVTSLTPSDTNMGSGQEL